MKEIHKAGPVTLALGLIAGGTLLLLYNFGAVPSLQWLWRLWPVLLIGLGLEYFLKKAVYREGEVQFHAPSIVLLLVFILAGGVFHAAASIGRNVDDILEGLPWHRAPLTYSRTWTAEPLAMQPGERLVVDNERGQVQLVPAADNRLRVEAVIRSPESGPARALAGRVNPSVRRDGAAVSVVVPETESWGDHYLVVDLQVAVPAGVDVRVDSGTGRVTAENLDGSLVVAGNTSSIELEDIGGNIEARNNTGKIEVLNPAGNVVAETNTGSIALSSDRPLQGEYELESNTGRISMSLPAESSLVIEAISSTGRVSVDGIPRAGDNDAGGPGDKFRYQLGAGEGRAKLRVGTGVVKIEVR